MAARRPIRRVVLGVLGAAALAFVFLVVFRVPIPVNALGPKIEAGLERVLGREAAVEGTVAVVIGFSPEVRVANLAVANPGGWGEGEPFAAVERVGLKMELGALLRKEIVVKRLAVEGVRLALEERGEGAVNWEFGGREGKPAAGAEGNSYEFGGVDAVAVRDLEVFFTDAEGSRKSVAELAELEGSAVAGAPVVFEAKGNCIDRPIALQIEGESLEALLARERGWPFTAAGTLGLAKVEVAGELPARGEAGRGFRFAAALPRLDDFEAVTGPLPDPGALAFSGEAQFVEGGFRIPEMAGTMGDSAFSGWLATDLSGPVPRVDGAMDFDRLKVATFRDDDEGGEEKPVVSFDEAFGQDVDMADSSGERALIGFTGKLEVSVEHLLGKRGDLRHVRLIAETDADGTSLRGSAEFGKSHFEAKAEIRRAPGKGLRFGAVLASEDAELRELLGIFFGESEATAIGGTLAYSFEGAGENWVEVREGAVWELAVAVGTSSLEWKREPGVEGYAAVLAGRRLAELATVFDEVPEWDLAYSLSGQFHTRDAEASWRVEEMEARIGEDIFIGRVGRPLEGGLKIALKGTDVAVGRILGDLDVIEEGVAADAKEVELAASIRGKTRREVLSQSDFAATLRSGSWLIGDAGDAERLDLDFDEVKITSEKGEPLRFEIDGRLSDAALKLRGESDGLMAIAKQSQDMHLLVEAAIGESKLVFDDRVALPLDRSDFSGELKLEGGAMSELNKLLDAELPEWGPYSVTAEFGFLEDGYRFDDIVAKLGETDLAGNLRVRTGGERLRLEGSFSSERIQVTDFHEAGWSPYGSGEGEKDEAKWRPGRNVGEFHGALASVLSAKVLESLNGEVSLKAGGVYSGEGRLGSGSVRVRLDGGKLRLAPAELNIPGGRVGLEIGFARPGKMIEMELGLRMDGFDYGAFGRHGNPDAAGGGRLEFAMEGRSLSPEAGKFWRYGSGTVSAAACPDRAGAQIFDLWATNLITSLIPKIDPERRSKINCIVAEAAVVKGVATFEKLLIDTTQVRAEGKGTIDFKKERVDLMLVPQAKTAQALSLATGVTIDGTFENFGRRVTAAEAIKTVSESGKRAVLFPLRFLKERTKQSETLPADGSDICSCAGK